MSQLEQFKITDQDIARQGVVAAPDRLTGTAEENKRIFDRLIRDSVKALFNGLIDLLSSASGAENIGLRNEDDSNTSVQAAIADLNTLMRTKAPVAQMNAALALKSNKSVTDLHFKSVSLDAQTGVFTFTRENGSFVTIDTVLEKVTTNWQYDAAAQSLVLTLADGTTQSVPLSAFITETEFVDSGQIDFSVSNHKVTATVKTGSITETMLSSALIAQLQGYVSAAAASAADADAAAAQVSTDKAAVAGYLQSACGYSEDAARSASAADSSVSDARDFSYTSQAWAVGRRGDTDVQPGDPAYQNHAKYWAEQAQTEAASAYSHADDSQAWAVGKRHGTDVPSSDPTYQNHAKYWAQQAHTAVAGAMQASGYDPQGVVAAAGGIPAYVSAQLAAAIGSAIGGSY